MLSSPKTLLAIVLVLPSLLSNALRAEEWPQWRGLNRDSHIFARSGKELVCASLEAPLKSEPSISTASDETFACLTPTPSAWARTPMA